MFGPTYACSARPGLLLRGWLAGTPREVTLTDQADRLFMAEYNVARNFGGPSGAELLPRFRVRPLKWGDAKMLADLEPPYDVLLGSDGRPLDTEHEPPSNLNGDK